MSGTQHVDCSHCGRRHQVTAEQARRERVQRCACGQFVRLDRAFPELRSPPEAKSDVALSAAIEEDEEEESTHMLGSLAAVAAMSGRSRARSSQASVHDDELVSRPVPRRTLHSVSTLPPSGDKPLWHVDLGGPDPVQMTIESLIIARRSGKLGEGALVWREGMQDWRPVGTLISAVSISERAPAPEPSRPASAPAAPLPRRPAALGQYERPAATLEFALERPTPPLPKVERSRVSPPPSRITVPPPAPRARPSMHSVAALRPLANTPLPATRPDVISVPPPPPPPPPAEFAAPLEPVPPAASTSNHPTQPPAARERGWLGERPLWQSACLAVVVCVVASGAGALLVRSLKQAPRALVPTATSASFSAATPAATSPSASTALPAPSTPKVVDLESLSVERRAPRWKPRPVAKPAASAPSATADDSEAEPNSASPDTNSDEPSP